MKNYNYYVYIVASKSKIIYIGMTGILEKRICEHKSLTIEGFTKKYKCTNLIYYEHCFSVEDAIRREKQIKNWNRNKKELIINQFNPE
ncbi:MAG: GIY-YIG nuclease family protein [Candidatus Gracilibacteria bacterium]|nr:GIY-YIG nuclease family protein [Candidatus Gracilibacteria bacterium]